MKTDDCFQIAGLFRAKRALALVVCLVFWLPVAAHTAQTAAATAAWADNLSNLEADEALTLFKLSRDLFPDPGLDDAAYMACIDPVDAAAADAQERAAIDNAMGLIDGAMRRMGHERYSDIADDYERTRMSKMLTEGRWLRQFRLRVGECLTARAGQQ
ncbi:MAG: hypothetical protein WDZ63_06280 [Burkholderiales bacterium]